MIHGASGLLDIRIYLDYCSNSTSGRVVLVCPGVRVGTSVLVVVSPNGACDAPITASGWLVDQSMPVPVSTVMQCGLVFSLLSSSGRLLARKALTATGKCVSGP